LQFGHPRSDDQLVWARPGREIRKQYGSWAQQLERCERFPDGAGGLQLRINQSNRIWQCAKIRSTQPFGFGRFQFWVGGPVDRLDNNVVLGLFQYSSKPYSLT
jgi:hypothetical protein